ASRKTFVIRDPGGRFRAAPEPGVALLPGEELFSEGTGGILFVPVEEAGGAVGAFAVPKKAGGPQTGGLHFDGTAWTREPICSAPSGPCTAPGTLAVLAIDASGPGNAWLLARGASAQGMLFRRDAGGEWRRQPLGAPGSLGSLFDQEKPIPGLTVGARAGGQPITVTATGVWVDATLTLQSPLVPKGPHANLHA